MRHLFLSITLLLTMIAGSISAQTVTEESAAAKANKFLRHGVNKAKGTSADLSPMRLAYKAEKNGETLFYIFNDTECGGFVIVAGDERATEILGYSTSGNVDYDNAPDNFKWWLEQYALQIDAAIQQNLQPSAKASAASASTRVTIPNLITTKWDQGAPYNKLVAQKSDHSNYVTGCVATAMAQVMRYHRCPTTGVGSHSYTLEGGATYSANFNVTYDWANMLDTYNKNQYTTAQADAVATLMYHAGVSVDMDYGTSSGAVPTNIPTALSTYFGYDKSIQYADRGYYTDAEWTDIIYNELLERRPVLYGGQDAYGGGGHQFVCHGYDATNNAFAINWGWSGYCDGYFTLMGVDGLQPMGSGSGGAGTSASYTNSQSIVFNIMPDHGGKAPLALKCYVADNLPLTLKQGDRNVTNVTVDLSKPSEALSLSFCPWNLSGDTRKFDTGVMFVDTSTGDYFYASKIGVERELLHGYLYNENIPIRPSDFSANGTYRVYPVVRESGTTEWQILRAPIGVIIPTITVTGAENPYVKETVTMTDFSMPNNGYLLRDEVKFTATFRNDTGNDYSPYYVYCKMTIGGYYWTKGWGYRTWYSGRSGEFTYDFSDCQQYIDAHIGKPCTVEFLDNDQDPISDVITFYPCNRLDVDYTLSSAGWGTLCLPFDAGVPKGLTAYSIVGTTDNSLNMVEAKRLLMNTPYLVTGTPASYTFTGPDTPVGSSWSDGLLVGNTAPTTNQPVYAPKGSYVLQQNNGKLGFYKVMDDGTQRIRQYSAYLDLKEASNYTYFALPLPTAIQSIEVPATEDHVRYNLNGIRVTGNPKGITITKGRKVLNK